MVKIILPVVLNSRATHLSPNLPFIITSHLMWYSTQSLEPLQSSFEILPVYHYLAVSSDGISQVSTLIEQIAAFYCRHYFLS